MTDAEQRFMAFEGIVEWTKAVIIQNERIEDARREMSAATLGNFDPNRFRFARLQLQAEAHLFAVAACQLLGQKGWLEELGAANEIDFSCLSEFSYQDIVDVRNMREHVVEYFKGEGKDKPRWIKSTEEFQSDASSIVETKIGGRLDWVEFSRAARNIHEQLLKLPIPFPPAPAGG